MTEELRHGEQAEPRPPHLLPLSARTADELVDLARAYRNWLVSDEGRQAPLRDICATASRHSHHEYRLALTVTSHEEAATRLAAFIESGAASMRRAAPRRGRLAFVFSGQGSQWLGMGHALLQRSPVFRAALERCDQVFRSYVDWSLLEELVADESRSRLHRIDVVQPALFAISVALAEEWKSWGIEPDVVVGHSMGESVAAYVAGALSLEDATLCICRASALLQRVAGQGAMAFVNLSREAAAEAMSPYGERLTLAGSNSPSATLLSGERAALDELMATLRRRNVFSRLVKINVAAHSPRMEVLREDFLQALAEVKPRSGTIPIYSTVTGERCDGSGFDAAYWMSNLRQPVLFSEMIQQLLAEGADTFIELSAHSLLTPAIEQGLEHSGRQGVALTSMRRGEDEHAVMLESLGSLYTTGFDVPWERLYPGSVRAIRLPSSPRPQEVAPEARPSSAPAGTELLRRVSRCPPEGRRQLLLDYMRGEVARVLGLKPVQLDPDMGFFQLGMDSLTATRLKTRLEAELGHTLSVTVLFEHASIRALSSYLSMRLAKEEARAPSPSEDTPTLASGRTALRPLEHAGTEPIAIIGMACRMPGGADSPDSFWELLRNGTDTIRDIPAERWDVDAFYDPDPSAPGKTYTRRGAFLEGIDRFDAPFFGISPREAAFMDPQQRLFLEVGWEALERAGQAPDKLAGSATGVFLGVTSADYCQSIIQRANPSELDAYYLTSNASTFAAGRFSYWLGLQGPSLSVDTACSSSLVAVHLACQSLRAGDCSMALAGGVNVLLSPESFVVLSKAHMMSPDGRCKTFDARADGYVRGEGCGVVVLERLSDALANNHPILAVIRGSAVNQDGRSSGITVPNAQAQQAVIRQALRTAGLPGWRVSYVEAHGTGTPLGDPIEVRSLSAVLGEGRAPHERFAIGSVKTNIGHLEPAAGVAGLIKTVLALRHEEIPPHLHLQQVNPELPLDELPVTIPTQVTPWPRTDLPRVAGVSSFGASGTNAHVILEEAPASGPVRTGTERPHHLLALSARTAEALPELARRYADHLTTHPETSVADVCFTANTGRSHFGHRLAVTAGTTEQLRERLAAFAEGRRPEGIQVGSTQAGNSPKVAFLFTGQGSQYVGMGRALYETQPVFRQTLLQCDELLRPHLDRPLFSVIYPNDGEASLLDETAYTQPALFALEYALAQLWRSWGVEPMALLGHSVGEYVAACLAGVFSLEEGLTLIARRGRLLQALPREGAMATVLARSEHVAEALVPYADALSIAALNGPESVVVSGARGALAELLARLGAEGIQSKPLATSHAFHSPLMEPALTSLEWAARLVTYSAPRIPVVSTVTGRLIQGAEMDARYFREHTRAPVRFLEGMQALVAQGCQTFIELGPAPVLLGMARRFVTDESMRWLPSLRKGHGEWQTLLRSLGALYANGAKIDWAGLDRGQPRRRVSLPTYPFQRRRYWFQPGARDTSAPAPAPISALAEEPRPAPSASETPSPRPAGGGLREKLGQETEAGRPALLQSFLAERIASVLGGAASDLDVNESLQNLGVDSLMGLELKNALQTELAVSLPLVALLEGPSIASLTSRLLPLLSEQAPRAEQQAGRGTGALPVVTPNEQERYEPFPLTDLQQAYLIGRTGAFELGNVSTYFFLEIELEGVDLERFGQAFQKLITRHDMLRAIFTPDGQQRVLREVPAYNIGTVDLRGREPSEVDAVLDAIRKEMAEQVFPTNHWPLFDIRATQLDGELTRIHMGLDALIIDGWSVSLLFREWARLYHEPDAPLPRLDITFRDYVLAARALEEGEAYQRSLEYWKQRVPTLPPAPELPLARNPATVVRPRFVHRGTRMGPEAWARFKQHATAHGVSPSAALCTAYAEVLSAWSKSRHFTLNLLFFNRLPLHPQVKDISANFSTTTLLEVDGTASASFQTRAKRLQQQLWSDLEHGHVSGVRVLRELNRVQGNASRAAMPVVFASTLNFQGRGDNQEREGLLQDFLRMSRAGREVHSCIRTPQVWLDHQVVEDGGRLLINWDVVEELFPEGMIPEMFRAYEELLHRLADDEEAWRESHRLLVPEPQLEVRRAVNATAAPVPPGLLHTRVEQAAAFHADRPAIITSRRTLTHGELDLRSNRLGRWLRERGARPNMLVGIVMEKGWEQLVAALGILKSGAAYVPIDAGLPRERLWHLLRHAEVELVLTQSHVERRTEWPEGLQRLCVDEPSAEAPDAAPLEPLQHPEDLAYVIYTSGSTGLPKGVMIEHRSALNTVVDVNERFGAGSGDRVLALSALNFDLSVYDIFGLLSVGGAVVIPDASALREPAHWTELMTRHRVTIWNTVPALMEMWVDFLAGLGDGKGGPVHPAAEALRVVMMSGDWIPVTLPERIRALVPGAGIHSLGGATEAAIWSIHYPIDRVDPAWVSIPYGAPMRNQQFYALNESLQPCPTWVPGQLYIGGIGVARGYLKDTARTRASFIRHPLTGERLYRTGDLGRYLPDGNIEFLGREDFQVKVQGYRIELGEIEVALSQHPGVRAAVAAAVGERHGSKRLAAYVVLDPAQPPTQDELRDALRRKIPEYAVPQVFVTLDALPLSANGKVDRKALPALLEDRTTQERTYEAPRDALEAQLVELWEEFLEARPIGIRDGFFDLGGHSMLAVRLMARIQKRFGQQLPLSTLFAKPTIHCLAETLRHGTTSGRREPLVTIQSSGSKPPFFCVHPVGGDVLCYAELARALGSEHPFHGLQVPDPKNGEAPPTRIEQMAAAYIEAIRAIQPEGPYHLGGWSMGGVVAFEMARQLRDAGQEVAALALLDVSEPPRQDLHRDVDDATLLSWFARDLGGLVGERLDVPAEALRHLEPQEQFKYLLGQAHQAAVLPRDVEAATLERFLETFRQNFRALLGYKAGAYDGELLFVRARDHGATPEAAVAWCALARGGSTLVEVPGDHYSVTRQPHVHRVAEALRRYLGGEAEAPTYLGEVLAS
ncbi:amino acid adenylation domain-containing protein [Archangium violaceum]|uniref:amino acid adenylation domain-containing protein n=1 Tax=Archangium violaceum TaxID=83451 RepID=UPI002B2C361F|nr:amino acid adenylation domain-containing protein [Archangium gephyra]